MEYKFPKALYRRKELLTLIEVASSTVDSWVAKLKSQKRDLREMGCYQLKACKYDLWNPVEFIHFLTTERTQLRVGRKKLDNIEKYQLNHINHVLTVVQNNHEQKEQI